MVARLRLAPSPPGDGAIAEGNLPIRVVLADDHALMRRGLRLLLESAEGVQVIAEAGELTSAVRQVRRYQPDVLVLDLRMPGGSSIEAIAEVHEHAPDTEVVIVTMEDDPGFAQHALSGGAVGYVLKDLADSELPQAIRAARRREEYISPRLVAHRRRRTAHSPEG
jgi:two-component system, NarL family, response regulator NreC